VSCGLDAFPREAAELGAAGLVLAEIAAFDLFPFTGHVATVARLERCRRSSPAPFRHGGPARPGRPALVDGET
jgi:hypothetical protein